MRFTGKERKMYVLALGLLVAAIALACTWTMWERPSSQTSLSAETPTPGALGNACGGRNAAAGGERRTGSDGRPGGERRAGG